MDLVPLPRSPSSNLGLAEFQGQLVLTRSRVPDTLHPPAVSPSLAAANCGSGSCPKDRSSFNAAMTLINAGQEHAQGITKRILRSPEKHMESKARGCGLSSPRNTTMLQPQKVYIN